MANPFFSNSPNFGKSQPTGEAAYGQQYGVPQQQPQYGQPQYGQQFPGAGTATAPQDQVFAQVEQSYYQPSATAAQTGRMTIDDVVMKSATVLGTIILVAALAWFAVPNSMAMPVLVIGALGGFVLGLVNSFKKSPSPALIMGYAVFEGAFLGVISKLFAATYYQGIVMQAILATLITFGICIALYKSRLVKVNAKFTKIMMVGLISYAGFALVNLGIMIFAPNAFGDWGLRSNPLMALAIGGIAIVLASMTIISDFHNIEQGVKNGVERKYAWSAAFGLALSLVWLYLEFLRLLAILSGRD